MKYDNVVIDLNPTPVLQELIEDLTNKMLSQKQYLEDYKYIKGSNDVDMLGKCLNVIIGLKAEIKILDDVIERCYMQQELIDMRAEQIIGLN